MLELAQVLGWITLGAVIWLLFGYFASCLLYGTWRRDPEFRTAKYSKFDYFRIRASLLTAMICGPFSLAIVVCSAIHHRTHLGFTFVPPAAVLR